MCCPSEMHRSLTLTLQRKEKGKAPFSYLLLLLPLGSPHLSACLGCLYFFRPSFLAHMAVDIRLLGATVNIIDSRPRELMAIYLEDIMLQSPEQSRAIDFSLHHFEISSVTLS